MLYTITLYIVRGLIFLLNGSIDIQGRENLPKEGYVIVSPHRSWLDPVVVALGVFPQSLVLMAKKELFVYPIFGWFIKKLGAFPVDRENPGPSAIKYPVQKIKEGKSLVIFPTGTRYSDEMKGGAVSIARLAKAPIVPVVYQGPFSFKQLIMRKKMYVRIGEPMYLPEGRMSKEATNVYDQKIVELFHAMDKDINPNFTYVIPEKKGK